VPGVTGQNEKGQGLRTSPLPGKVAVAGASHGIDRAMALRLAQDDVTVAVHLAHGKDAAEEMVGSIVED
jgi:NAD(P)-dependent dehydrogenase (short-subunit alcohol dehydrogenase family)